MSSESIALREDDDESGSCVASQSSPASLPGEVVRDEIDDGEVKRFVAEEVDENESDDNTIVEEETLREEQSLLDEMRSVCSLQSSMSIPSINRFFA
jgi:hypothetical protein